MYNHSRYNILERITFMKHHHCLYMDVRELLTSSLSVYGHSEDYSRHHFLCIELLRITHVIIFCVSDEFLHLQHLPEKRKREYR